MTRTDDVAKERRDEDASTAFLQWLTMAGNVFGLVDQFVNIFRGSFTRLDAQRVAEEQ